MIEVDVISQSVGSFRMGVVFYTARGLCDDDNVALEQEKVHNLELQPGITVGIYVTKQGDQLRGEIMEAEIGAYSGATCCTILVEKLVWSEFAKQIAVKGVRVECVDDGRVYLSSGAMIDTIGERVDRILLVGTAEWSRWDNKTIKRRDTVEEISRVVSLSNGEGGETKPETKPGRS